MTDMQSKMKQEEERLAKLDPWKVNFFLSFFPCLLFFFCFVFITFLLICLVLLGDVHLKISCMEWFLRIFFQCAQPQNSNFICEFLHQDFQILKMNLRGWPFKWKLQGFLLRFFVDIWQNEIKDTFTFESLQRAVWFSFLSFHTGGLPYKPGGFVEVSSPSHNCYYCILI